MEKTLDKLCTSKKQLTFKMILETFEEQKYCIVDFLYFATIVSQYLFSEDPLSDIKLKIKKNEKNLKKINKLKYKLYKFLFFKKKYIKDSKKISLKPNSLLYKDLYPEQSKYLIGGLDNMKMTDFKFSLLKSDFLMPDGIALQLFYFIYKIKLLIKSGFKKKQKVFLPNLNGSDFTPYFLEEIRNNYGNQKLCILLYGTTAENINPTKDFLTYKGYNVIYSQDGYTPFDRVKAEKTIEEYSDTINVLLVSRSTPQIPLQTLRANKEKNKIIDNKLIVFNVGGLFDHMIGDQKRAPKLIRLIKLERLWRVVLYPKRNIPKVMHSLLVFFYIFRYLLLKKK